MIISLGTGQISRIPGLRPKGRTPKFFPQYGFILAPYSPRGSLERIPKPRGTTLGVEYQSVTTGVAYARPARRFLNSPVNPGSFPLLVVDNILHDLTIQTSPPTIPTLRVMQDL